MSEVGQDRYVVISTDGHCGADVLAYKPYLPRQYHDEFDAWAATYHDPWGDLDSANPPSNRVGYASFNTTLNWDSDERQALVEEQGVVAEILFPNTAPPFIPSNAFAAPAPLSRHEYEYRFVGIQAHNRWLAEFCAQVPGRRAGIAQIFVNDLDDAIKEVQWAKQAGLMGVLLPGDHVLSMANYYYPEFDRLWAVCADLDMPIHRHGTNPCEGAEVAPAAPWIGSVECVLFSTRAIAHLICSGAFERHPNLKYVSTELLNGSAIPDLLAKLDAMASPAMLPMLPWIAEAAGALSRKPSEYFATNCYVGGPLDFRLAMDAQTPNLMFGIDAPHSEGTWPYTVEALRVMLSDVPVAQTRQLLSETAAHVYGFDLGALQTVADRIGPSVSEVSTPLPESEKPKIPTDTRCRAFA
jgi:predicted TIM-barrel fold metal-dependent hydrolase